MSDGLQEMFNEKGDILGDDRVIEGFKSCGHDSPDNIIKQLTQIAETWAGNHPQEDDMTLMVIRIK